MTKDETNLIMFLETQIVDHAGLVFGASMNAADFKIAKRWTKEGFIEFSRIPMREIRSERTHRVQFSPEAWDLAHASRRARGQRLVETLPSRELPAPAPPN